MKQFTFSTTHKHKDGPFPVDFFGNDIPNVTVTKLPVDEDTDNYTFKVYISDDEDPLEWAFHIGRAVQEKRHAILMKDTINRHFDDISN